MVKYVLVLEGGGVRSALGLQFLTELEKCYEVNLSENVDVFAGGNTSAVTALAFAQGKSAQNILSVMYEESQPQTLMLKSSSSSSLQHLYKSRPLYPVESKNNVLTKILENESIHSLDKCVIVPLYSLESRELLLISSDPDICEYNASVVDIANGASSTPIYFPAIKMQYEGPPIVNATQKKSEKKSKGQKNEMWVIDGSVVGNDLIASAIGAARKKFGKNELLRVMVVGAGKPVQPIQGPEASSFGALEWIQHDLVGISLQNPYSNSASSQLLSFAFPNTEILNVNINLTSASESFDDTSESNISALKELGKLMFEQYSQQLTQFLGLSQISKPKASKKKKEDTKDEKKKEKSKEDKKEEKRKEKEKEKKEKEEREKKEKEEREKKEKEERERLEKEKAKGQKEQSETESESDDSEEDSEEDDSDDDEDSEEEEKEKEKEKTKKDQTVPEKENDKEKNKKKEEKKKKEKGDEDDSDEDEDEDEDEDDGGCVIS